MFPRFFRWLIIAFGGLLALAVVAVLAVYGITEWQFDQTFDVAADPITVPSGEAAIEEGRRLAALRGCNGGCHGPNGGGRVFFEMPDGTRVVAPSLAQVAAGYSDADLARAIRHGVRPDGTSVFSFMPSEMFYHLSDDDLGRLLAWIRSLPAADAGLPSTRLGPIVRAMILKFEGEDFQPLAAQAIDRSAPPAAPGGDAQARGRYLAMTVCTECHGMDLEGTSIGMVTPSLQIARSYDEAAFELLMTEGIALGGREVGLMTQVARGRFSHFTADERADLLAWLKSR